MTNNEILKIIISFGEIVDKFLVNSIKIEKIKDDGIEELISNNNSIKKVIDEWSFDCDKEKLNFYTNSLLGVLQEQWNYLDIVLNKNEDIKKRMEHALLAQNLNVDRVHWKNKINTLVGCSQEIKKYGEE